MEIKLSTPTPASIDTIISVLASWQNDTTSNPIHPGDLGWFQRFGAENLASHIRIWSSTVDDTILAIGLLDGDDLLRATTAPSARRDEVLAHAMTTDISEPTKNVLPAGRVSLDLPHDALVWERIAALNGWSEDEEWTWLRMDLTADGVCSNNSDGRIHVEIVKSPEQVQQRVAVHGLAFRTSSLTVERWQAMSKSEAYKTARCLLAYDHSENDENENEAVGAVTIWSAGPGKAGILEPVGVSVERQGRGYGTALCREAAAQLQRMGASSAVVGTPSSNTAAVSTYKRAGFKVIRTSRDLCRAE